MSTNSPFSFSELPLRAPEFAPQLGSTVVIAPHPDDEALGCGGLLALLRRAQVPVWAVLITDGTMSHPNSVKYPPAARQALREAEFRMALGELEITTAPLCLGLPDGELAAMHTEAFETAAMQLQTFITQHQPTTILAPWRRDPHPDHRATSQLVQAALVAIQRRRASLNT